MDESQVVRYLDRFGASRPVPPDVHGLRSLQLAHLKAVPFENLSIHLGEPISLEPDALFDKLVTRRRGGFCYEQNGLFAALLTALGYRVTLLAARVFGAGRPGPLFDHLALRVDLDEPWLVDVGFGDFADEPLRLGERGEQKDPAGVFRIVPAPGDQGDLDVLYNGEPGYRLTARPYELADFVPTCWWQSTSPDSHFTRSPVCSIRTAEGRTTISGRKLIVTRQGERAERILNENELLQAYREHFGVTLDRPPAAGA
ncbi:acetyltransferase [Nonomuraea sp. WAC 01424]|uniref:arylamine N-acetyltransferase family protein n=1 Tax=Nonomuraea sp. WAC 01424 TaxID=2203200 RepID=UPI000F7A10D4|nr:arylamine N-acetyltransferase [Nonomuraea sp. WAC 01424]RSN01845.1 acetyltransferase [Nonomuraea sp. WAC 01424]